jgi:glycine betaine/choline ABC-type transport system substrate-binding protein
VEIERLEQKVEKKAKELVEQLEGKLSTAEQTLYPLVGGRNAFSEKRLEQNSLIIGSKDFAANIVVAELVAQYLELNGIKCERRIPNGGTVTNYAALSNGWIDLFVDYTGTGCMLFNIDFHEKTEDEILTTLNILSQERYGFEWLEPFGTKTNYCLVMKQSFADENHIESISDINNYGLGRLRFCANYEFMNRLDGFPGLKETYKLRFLSEKIVSYADRYNYIDNDEADISVGHTTDPSLRALNLKELVDDKQFFPDYLETPLVRSEALYMIGGLRDLLNGIKELRLKDDDITTLIHDYNTNVDSLSNSVRKMIQDKKEKMPQG